MASLSSSSPTCFPLISLTGTRMVINSCLGLLLLALNGLAHHHQAAASAGHSPTHGNQVALGIHQSHLEVLHGRLCVAHMTWPAHARVRVTRRRAGAARTRRAMAIRLAMRLRTTGKAIALNGTGKTSALRYARHIYYLAFSKH